MNTEFYQENIRRIEIVFWNAQIEAYSTEIVQGPLSVRYDFRLGRGVRLFQVQSLSDEIAFSLNSESVSIAPVVGKPATIGVEVPNKKTANVPLAEVMRSTEFTQNDSKLAFAVGKDAIGKSIVRDLQTERNILIGGTTGSGKSTFIHTLILSLIYRNTPDNLRFIMIDSKGIELIRYNEIPHMLLPVITNSRQAEGAIQWIEIEINRRISLLSKHCAKNIQTYNMQLSGTAAEILPFIAVIIDDYSHLVTGDSETLEEKIKNIVKQGYLVGVHLILSTQFTASASFSRIVNLKNSARVAFAMTAEVKSVLFLEQSGAESLNSGGDMLYAMRDSFTPLHIQGCMVSTNNIVSTIESLVPKNSEKDMSSIGHNYAMHVQPDVAVQIAQKTEDRDVQYLRAVDVVLEMGQVSVSMLQRKLKIGYTQASGIVDKMEHEGIISSFQGMKPRSILVTKEQWERDKKNRT